MYSMLSFCFKFLKKQQRTVERYKKEITTVASYKEGMNDFSLTSFSLKYL